MEARGVSRQFAGHGVCVVDTRLSRDSTALLRPSFPGLLAALVIVLVLAFCNELSALDKNYLPSFSVFIYLTV